LAIDRGQWSVWLSGELLLALVSTVILGFVPRGINDPYLSLTIRVASFMPRPHYPWEKSPRYAFGSRLVGPQNHSGRCGEETTLLPLSSIETLFFGGPARSPLCMPTEGNNNNNNVVNDITESLASSRPVNTRNRKFN
jgi:hypothetical protein